MAARLHRVRTAGEACRPAQGAARNGVRAAAHHYAYQDEPADGVGYCMTDNEKQTLVDALGPILARVRRDVC